MPLPIAIAKRTTPAFGGGEAPVCKTDDRWIYRRDHGAISAAKAMSREGKGTQAVSEAGVAI
jgi:hypothetical protein